ncbi:hypothetical protein PT974_06087 [Cladobotryum mycophilum]|uniref:Uncharacterized protein n=1 Tax=Cladobotryum mycophilum TaxID=491253 RepID=A0ABR0SL88_9HYPO
MSDARSGLGRIKDAVGVRGRGHGTRLSISTKEEVLESGNGVAGLPGPSSNNGSSPAIVSRTFTWKNKPEEYLAAMKRGDPDVLPGLMEESQDTSLTVDLKTARLFVEDDRKPRDPERTLENTSLDVRIPLHRRAPSTAPSAVDDGYTDVASPDIGQKSNMRPLALLRRHSLEVSELSMKHVLNENRWARRMSFGDAEQAVLTWDEIIDIDEAADDFADAEAQAVAASRLNQCINDIVHGIEPWVNKKIDMVKLLNDQYARDKAEIQNLYYQLSEACQRVQYSSDEILAEERATLTENVKEIEVLVARLDYEINALVQRVHDVEDGIQNFERQVEEVEKRADELKAQLETESWLHWFVRTLTGVGTGPNITRSVQ